MSVQINNGKVSDEHNGLQAMIAELLRFSDSDRVTAVITYKVTKKTQDMETGDDYPVLRATHIEPILALDGLEMVRSIQQSAFQVRTGETTLDLYPIEEAAADAAFDPDNTFDAAFADEEIDDDDPFDGGAAA